MSNDIIIIVAVLVGYTLGWLSTTSIETREKIKKQIKLSTPNFLKSKVNIISPSQKLKEKNFYKNVTQ